MVAGFGCDVGFIESPALEMIFIDYLFKNKFVVL